MELMVTIGIIGILCGIALPGFIGWLPRYRMSASAREVKGVFEHARLTAIKRSTDVVVDLNFANETVTTSINGGTVRLVRMAAGIDLKNVDLGAQFRFNSQGMPVFADGVPRSLRVAVSRGGGLPDKQILVSAGGNIRIQ
jgi:Tfp pilus assembly protein FimT